MTEYRQSSASPCLPSLEAALRMTQARVPRPLRRRNAAAHLLQIEIVAKAWDFGHRLPACHSKRKRVRRISLMVQPRIGAACLTSGGYILRTRPERMTHRNASLRRETRRHSCEAPLCVDGRA